ncbi:MAG: hypothetical protein HY272_11850 [Gammaproteobacteria bacterium]|nr:hypothetical protein [Gammaproteobacteria bacterium]
MSSPTMQLQSRSKDVPDQIPQYDAIGMEALAELLRNELIRIHDREDGIDSINKLSARINVSRAYLAKFRDGGMVCMNIMNRIAWAFNIKYMIENYEDQKLTRIE